MGLYLKPGEVLTLYRELESQYRLDPQPPRDPVALELACARPQVGNYGNIFNEAAVLVESLVSSRPFAQLNTAVAFAAMVTLLGMQGYRLACPPGEAVRAFNRWATPSAEWPHIAAWLSVTAKPLEPTN